MSLETCRVDSDAVMLAASKTDMAQRTARRIEAIGVGELARVAIRRLQQQENPLSRAKFCSGDLSWPSECAPDRLQNTLVPDHFFKAISGPRRVGDECASLVGRHSQLANASRENFGQCFCSADEERN